VECQDQAEVDRYWDQLTGNGGEPSVCGWLKDPFGVSWQIVPEALMRLQDTPDREAASRVFNAMLKMAKIDVAALEAAAAG
jgi:predicted 3-demethylubiquinone-9 3-methyltransferase (glyoxalase superfamily)